MVSESWSPTIGISSWTNALCRACPYSDRQLNHARGYDLGSIARTQARSEAHRKSCRPGRIRLMDEIDVKRISRLGKVGLFPDSYGRNKFATER